MRGDDDCHANILKSTKQAHDLQRKVWIEIACGLVGENDLRIGNHGSRDADELLLAS